MTVINPLLYIHPVTRARIRSRLAVYADRLAWTFIVAAALYVVGHVFVAMLHLRDVLIWHGY